MLLTIGDPDHAVQCLLRATGYDKSNADAYYYLGVATANKAHFDDAERFFSRALELDAGHEAALRDSSLVYVVTGQTDKAAERIAQARAALPKDFELRMLDYGLRLMRLTDFCGHLLSRLDPRRVLRR
ncbi:MAG: tetratricopeptide repeat protein, partial [Sedimentisphaerales bacterium]|nr:tetratricopeptide repeat protein [Sedimentisphaerales bacterium]